MILQLNTAQTQRAYTLHVSTKQYNRTQYTYRHLCVTYTIAARLGTKHHTALAWWRDLGLGEGDGLHRTVHRARPVPRGGLQRDTLRIRIRRKVDHHVLLALPIFVLIVVLLRFGILRWSPARSLWLFHIWLWLFHQKHHSALILNDEEFA